MLATTDRTGGRAELGKGVMGERKERLAGNFPGEKTRRLVRVVAYGAKDKDQG